jgi:hypothetical protein
MSSSASVTRAEVNLLEDNLIGTAIHADRIGKVFYVLDQDIRQCLICNGVFTCQAAAEHAGTACLDRTDPLSFDRERTDANW